MFPHWLLLICATKHSLHLDANTRELGKKWREWDEATINSYRLQFRAIDLNEDGLIDFKEL